jgi:hypothetical protein
MRKNRVELGDKVRDRLTGFEGIAIGRTQWLHGCERIIIQPDKLHEGKTIDAMTFDEPQIDVRIEGAYEPAASEKTVKARPGGPRPEATRHANQAR